MNWLAAVVVLVLVGVLLVVAPFVLREASFEGCDSVNDCVTMPKSFGGCGCNAGGALTALSKESWYYKTFYRLEKYAGGVCPQVISDSPSCKAKLKCVKNKCVLG